MCNFLPISRRFHRYRYILHLHLLSCLTNNVNNQVSTLGNICFYQNDIRNLFSTRTCQGHFQKSTTTTKCPEMPLDVKVAPIGVEIKGIDLKEPVSEELIKRFREDVHKHKLLIFKDQGVVSGERQVEISQWFGELESTFYKHPRSPHPDVFRVSNVESEGCRNVGRTGWHIDGSFMSEPFGFAVYHMSSVPKKGNTEFVSLKDLIESLNKETRQKWERLWMVSDRRGSLYHPLIYPHPVTKQPTLCFHLGMTDSFVWGVGTDQPREASGLETLQILKEILHEITKDDRRLIYSHKWEVGDFIISDNLAVGHEATPETQFPVSEVGLRVLHRTTIRGLHKPQK